jgi:hypothetical protein
MLSSCVPSGGTNSRTVTDGSSDDLGGTTVTGTGDDPGTSDGGGGSSSNSGTVFSSPVVWYSNTAFDGIVTLNSNYTDSLYLRGSDVDKFVQTDQPEVPISDKKYCLVISYNQAIANYPVRLLATPFRFASGQAGSDYGLKIHVADKSLNESTCTGNVNLYNFPQNSTNSVASVLETTNGAYSLPDLCPSCGGAETSQDVRIYRVSSLRSCSVVNGQESNCIRTYHGLDKNWLNTIMSTGSQTQDLEMNNLQLRIDYSSTVEESGSQCTNTSCRAEGFDCCVDGIQCANDGQERPETKDAFACIKHEEENDNDYSRCGPEFNVSSYNNTLIRYGQAYFDSKIFNENNFLRYPNFYFTCSSTTPEPVEQETTGPENPDQDAEDRLNQLITEFNCLEEGKKDNPEYSANQVCPPTFDQTAYTATRLKVWKDCGCDADPFPVSTDDLRCPDFGLTAIRNSANTITRVECYTPPIIVETPPFQELDLAVQNRSVPHRFFASDGTEHEDISKLGSNSNVEQEGDKFSYLDESSKQGPQFGGPGADITEQGFGMNSILGRMSINLDRALPAQVVNVEFDQFYIVSANSGFFTPCPQCVPDSWFPTFKSFPGSTNGLGVRATGYTTSRSEYRDNYSLGNYEDTKFGRACWVPPTMLPFSHMPNADAQTQRLNRLKTQAALYANGYQKDWFGFNQGALIGSFDGVSWFAIGKGRRVQAKSDKLYLAINAPFADLADPGSTTVSIVVDLGSNVAADYDFDPELELNHPAQNEAGSCQSYHQCNTDTDCIAQLGWEYSCLDINELKSHWPQFDVDGKEKTNAQLANQSWDQILNGGINGENPKRCVYRGMGAVCKQNYTTLNSARPDLQRAFRCAPNFYCADLSSSQFNDNVVRSPNQLNVYFYGFEADFLGRPQTYLGANRPLLSEIQENLVHNMRLFSSDINDFGLCRPGRSLESASDLTNHGDVDPRGRTDYISQIGSCDSNVSGNQRTQTCPLIDTDPDSSTFGNIIDGDTAQRDEKLKQNMCGGESQFFDDDSQKKSTFSEIELEKLSSLFSLTVPGLAADACLRRAGEVCFSDLDCGPNRLHAQQAIFLSTDRFGGSEAEKSFWSESLVCSQAAEVPTLQAGDFFDYDLTKNRCCREVSSDFTMYTQIDSLPISPDVGEQNLGLQMGTHTAINPTQANRYSRYNSLSLIYGSAITNNYTQDEDDNGKFDTNNFVVPSVTILDNDDDDSDGNDESHMKPDKFQWRTFQETGKLTCCGGGWVRKFADGTKDWSNNLRQNYNTSNFQCLNYQDTMYKDKPADTPQGSYNKEKSKLCFTPDKEGCVQAPINEEEGEGFDIIPPVARSTAVASIDTTPDDFAAQSDQTAVTLSRSAPYIPLPANNGNPFRSGESSAFFPFWPGHHFSTGEPTISKHAISIHLPIYVGGPANITSIEVHYEHNALELLAGSKFVTATQDQDICQALDNVSVQTAHNTFRGSTGANSTEAQDGDATEFCIQYTGDQYILHVTAEYNPGLYINIGEEETDANGDAQTELPWDWAGVRINFNPIGTNTEVTLNKAIPTVMGDFTINRNPADADVFSLASSNQGLVPGNALYYLSKLGRFELTGIPQIVYEPLYCNDDKSKLVPGIFNSDITTRTDFEDNSFQYDSGNTALERFYDPDYGATDGSKVDDPDGSGNTDVSGGSRVVYQDKVQLNKVFSGHEFRCCSKLGTVVTAADRCCSGHAVDADGDTNPDDVGKFICKLPRNTNLNVYFNRFVSSEGTIDDDPDNGLREDDFVAETGEPKIQSSTYTKLAALASQHCDSGEFRRGASFGKYPAQPNTGFFGDVENDDLTFYYSMVDSSQDFDGDNEKGFDFFIFGLRWDHNFYCN